MRRERWEEIMATESRPTEADINGFLDKLRAFRDTLPEGDQRLLNAMYFAAMGKQAEADEDVKSYWVAVNPVGPAGGPGYGYAAVNPVGPAGGPGYGAAGMYGSPWGAAYGAYYPRYW
jgi:hypothetical protein